MSDRRKLERLNEKWHAKLDEMCGYSKSIQVLKKARVKSSKQFDEICRQIKQLETKGE